MAKVLVAIPVRQRFGQPCYKTQVCLDLMRQQSKEHAIEVFLAGGQQISQNSLTICNKMLAESWDYLLYTGDDIIFPPYALNRLLSHNKDFVSGVCTWKSPPYMVPVMKVDPEDGKPKHLLIRPENVQHQDLIEVDGVGSGFILVKRKVIESIRDYMRDEVYPKMKDGDLKWFAPLPFFSVGVNAETGEIMGSDYFFSKQAKLAGAEIYIDCGVICRHRWEGEYDIMTHWAWLERYGASTDEERFFGDQVAYKPFDESSIYWGEQGPPVNITVTSAANIYHAQEHVCPILGCFFEPIMAEGAAKTKAGYIIGWHVNDDQTWHAYTGWAKRFDTVLIHWVGSDILRIPVWLNSRERVAHMNHPRFVHLVEDERLVPEVKEYFENVHVCAMPTVRSWPVQPLPKKFTVAIYYPKHRHDFHYGDVMKEVIEKMPDVQFKLYHLYGEKPDFEYPNMEWLGNLDVGGYGKLLTDSSCMLRLSEHDGRSFSIVEAAIMGRRFVTNQEMPFAHRVIDPTDAGDVIKMLRKVEKFTEPDTDASEYYRAENDYRKYKDKIRAFMGSTVKAIGGYDYRQYWDTRWNDDKGGMGIYGERDDIVNGILAEVIADTGSESLLDVGCGAAHRWKELPVEDSQYVGVDISPKAIKRAAEKFPEATFFVADATADTLPMKDVVFAAGVLPHIKPEHFKTTIKKLAKLGKKAVVLSHSIRGRSGGYQFPIPPVSEWRLGSGWEVEERMENEGYPDALKDAGIAVVVLKKKGAPVLVKQE